MIPPVVDVAWLREHEDGVVLVDVRWYPDGRSGREAYLAGHLPGAVYLDVDTELAGPPTADTGRHPLPEPEAFAAALSAAGISERDRVVGYDDAGGVIAARLVWMLRVLGAEAALLDGGIAAWDGPLGSGAVTRTATRLAARPWPAERIASLADVAAGSFRVIDARAAERYRGEPDALDPVAGHIPGSVSVPCREHVDAEGRLRPVTELRARFAQAGVQHAADVVSSCGSGVTACHNLLVLEHAGLGRGRLFPGSWSQYCRSGLPVAIGPDPG